MAKDKLLWISFFVIGTINNLPYVIVNSAASTIVDRFDVSNLVGLVFGANVGLALFAKGLNTFFLLKVPFGIRFFINGCLMLIGLLGVAFANSFGLALACIVVVGSSAAFGENLTLGFMSYFPSFCINAWSSGTGMAGLLGSAIYIAFGCVVNQESSSDRTQHLTTLTKYAFLGTTPVVVIYWVATAAALKLRPENPADDVTAPINAENEKDADTDADVTKPLLTNEAPPDCQPHLTVVEETILRKVWRSLILIKWMAFNLAAVYVLEYVARGCAAKVRPKDEYNRGCPELYAALQFCYQAGVFVSRSSVQMFPIHKVEVLTVLQLFNMILWLVDVKYQFMPIAPLPSLMIFVGLLGGASYVNIFHIIRTQDKFSQHKELNMNVTGLFITLGIILGSVLETLLFTTALKGR